MNKLIVIMGHGKAQSVFDRHVPLWCENDSPTLVFCPGDDVVKTHWPVLSIGTSSHHDENANRRFKRLLQFMEKLSFDEFVIFEYDSFCLSNSIPESPCGKISGNYWKNNDPDRFKGSHWLHMPLAFSKDILERINKAAQGIPDSAEEGFMDRWLGLVCDVAGIQPAGWGKDGFSRNTIEPWDIPEAVAARKAGAFLFHGVKTEAALKAILNA